MNGLISLPAGQNFLTIDNIWWLKSLNLKAMKLIGKLTLHKKWSFPLKISSVNVTKFAVVWMVIYCSDFSRKLLISFCWKKYLQKSKIQAIFTKVTLINIFDQRHWNSFWSHCTVVYLTLFLRASINVFFLLNTGVKKTLFLTLILQLVAHVLINKWNVAFLKYKYTQIIEGALMQIRKSANIFVFKWK